MAELLLVEDDSSLGETLQERLMREGYGVTWVKTKTAALAQFQSATRFDLLILDIGLPDGSGLDLGRDLRFSFDVPIIFLSAMSSAEYRLEGFEIGALDYIPKPFHLKELLLRVRRVLESRGVRNVLDVGIVRLDVDSLSIVFNDGTRVQPSPRDFQLLRLLIQAAPRVVSREEILQELWAGDSQQTGRTVDNAVVRIRQMLKPVGEDLIRSVRGVGYQWVHKAV